MTHALNLTLPLKQDPESKSRLRVLEASFATDIQPLIEAALKKSRLVHFARVLIIHDMFIQVITEYEGDHQEYTEFFRKELTPIFDAIFSLADGVTEVSDPNAFWQASKRANIRSLGSSSDGSTDFSGQPSEWLFSAYDHRDVRTIQAALAAE